MKPEYDFSQGKRGAIDPMPSGKTRITIQLDEDILEWFRNEVHTAGGGNYQTLINNALREYITQYKELPHHHLPFRSFQHLVGSG